MENVIRVLDQGGTVMWVLLGSSIVIWSALAWRFMSLRDHRFVTGRDLLDLGSAICTGKGQARHERIRGLQQDVLERLSAAEPAARENDLHVAIAESQRALAPPRDVVRSLIHAAPLLGLLGTVGGMIEIFMVIAQAGTSEPGMLAGGIGKALLTTQAGLLIAVLGIYSETRLSRWEQELLDKLEETRLVLNRCVREASNGVTA